MTRQDILLKISTDVLNLWDKRKNYKRFINNYKEALNFIVRGYEEYYTVEQLKECLAFVLSEEGKNRYDVFSTIIENSLLQAIYEHNNKGNIQRIIHKNRVAKGGIENLHI